MTRMLLPSSTRHARPCAGHPRLSSVTAGKTWMAGTSPATTKRWSVACMSPRRRPLHRGLALGIGGPQLHAGGIVVGVDGELAAFEQRLHAAIAELFRRRAAMQLRRQFHDERRLQRAVENQAGIALDLGDVVAVVMDAVAVEGQRRI